MELRDNKGLTEKEFLAIYAKKNYPRPYLTADVVFHNNKFIVFTLTHGEIGLTGNAEKSDLAFNHNRILIKAKKSFPNKGKELL